MSRNPCRDFHDLTYCGRPVIMGCTVCSSAGEMMAFTADVTVRRESEKTEKCRSCSIFGLLTGREL